MPCSCGLNDDGPSAITLGSQAAVGSQHPQQFVGRGSGGIFANDERCQVVNVGKLRSAPVHYGNRAVHSQVADGGACRFDTFCVGLQSLHHAVIGQMQGRGEPLRCRSPRAPPARRGSQPRKRSAGPRRPGRPRRLRRSLPRGCPGPKQSPGKPSGWKKAAAAISKPRASSGSGSRDWPPLG